MNAASLPRQDVLLLGVGHTHAHLLAMWRMRPLPDVRLTCVSLHPTATYSGMLSGVLAGQYEPGAMEIDLVRLCAAVGARLILGETEGLDVARQRLLMRGRPAVPFDLLSVGIGSIPSFDGVTVDDGAPVVAAKPMQTLLARLDERLAQATAARGGATLRVVVVGGGAAGVELALCLPHFVRRRAGANVSIDTTLISGRGDVLQDGLPTTAVRARAALRRHGVAMDDHRRVVRVSPTAVHCDDGPPLPADLVLWVTGAVADPLLRRLGLPTDDRGFLLTDATLRSTSGAQVFAVGDTGTIEHETLPKAGLHAVRHGPILWRNLPRALAGAALESYVPQRSFLKLLNTGDGGAIGEWRGISFQGRWAWHVKDHIDTSFVARYQDYTPAPMRREGPEPPSARQLRCSGCGGKVGANVLAGALARLDLPADPDVVAGLRERGDAAVLRVPSGNAVALTVDFFAAPLDDPYLTGRLAALNALSDALVVGAKPSAALAMVTLPAGPPAQQQELLYQLLAGGSDELRRLDVALVGGHTIEGQELVAGFTVLGGQRVWPPRGKSGARAGDRLILTKPLGTGVLLAAHMQGRCRAGWFTALVASMTAGNMPATACADEFGLTGITDVTGFGLAAHLMEMLVASNVAADLALAQVPLLPGAAVLLSEGLESTLAGANRTVESDIERPGSAAEPAYSALFDPQTCGGFLLSVPEGSAATVLAKLHRLGCDTAATIGAVVPVGSRRRRLRVL